MKLVLFLILILSSFCYGQVPKSAVNDAPSKKSKPIKQSDLPEDVKITQPVKPCFLPKATLEVVRGLYLGMPLEDTQTILPGLAPSVVTTMPKGISAAFVTPPRNTRFDGIKEIYLVFYRNLLVKFELQYIPKIQWDSVKEFKDQISQSMRIPSDVWTISADSKGFGLAIARCQDFEINISLLRFEQISYSILLEDKDYYGIAVKNAEQDKLNEKKTFKP